MNFYKVGNAKEKEKKKKKFQKKTDKKTEFIKLLVYYQRKFVSG